MDDALTLVLPHLACPICGAAFTARVHELACQTGHGFDLARQGYVSFLGGHRVATSGDTAAMVAARETFLGNRHYEPIAAAVSAAIPRDAEGFCVDLGGGTGYYLARLLEDHAGLHGITLDLSKFAVRRAAAAHPRAAAAAVDVWQRLPIRDATARCVLSVFAPRNAAEIRRVLEPRGVLIVVTPTEDHLAELVGTLGMISVDRRKEERLGIQLRDFTLLSTSLVEHRAAFGREDAADAVLMGPSAHHVVAEALADALSRLPEPVQATVSVNLAVYAPRE